MNRAHGIRRHYALLQLFSLALCAALLVVILVWQRGQPANSTELRIPIAELHAQAAEVVLLEAESAAGRLQQRFVRQHAGQLGDDVRTALDQLNQRRPEPPLATIQAEAGREGADLLATLQKLRAGDRQTLPECEAIRDRLATLEHRLRS